MRMDKTDKSRGFLDSFFKIKENGSTVYTEVIAGLTTFITMAYILTVNPAILSAAGMDPGSVFSATALSAAIATCIMGIYANLPIALAPGMGLNSFFAFSVVIGMGFSWQFALTAVFLEGIIFILLTLTNVRQAIMNCIPRDLSKGVSAGIGVFIAFIGLQSAGIVVAHESTLVDMGNLATPGTAVVVIGFFSTGIMLHYKVKGAFLFGIFLATLCGIPLGVTSIENFDTSLIFSIASLDPTFLQFDFSQVFSFEMLYVLGIFLFIDLFETVGMFLAIAGKAKLQDENGLLKNAKQAFMADAIGTTVGAVLGTSTVTSYVESTAGVAVGGRTGLTAIVVAILFFFALFLSPFFLFIPPHATAPILIIVGLMMVSSLKDLDFENYIVSIPAFVAFIAMPFTFSIANGIAWGIISYVILSILANRIKTIHPLLFGLAVLFILKFAFM